MLLDRSYFQLQAAFAARVAEVEAMSVTEACRLHTAFYALAKDNDVGVPSALQDFDPRHPAWVAFVSAVDAGADPGDRAYAAYMEGDAMGDDGAGPCFTYAYWREERLVRIHFSNDAHGTALRPETADARIAELRSIFATVACEHPEAEAVRGTSWLYHLEAYRRLFPPSFVSGLHSIGHPHRFAALWCQFIDRFGVVKPRLAEPFLCAVERATTMEDLNRAFPLDVLATTAPVATFLSHYGVG